MASVPRPLLRRSISIPGCVLGFAIVAVLSVVAVPVLGIIDQLRGRRRFQLARAWLLALAALATETIGILWLGAVWLRFAPLGRIDSPRSHAAIRRTQLWWTQSHLRGLRWFAGVNPEIDDPEALTEGNVVAAAHHVSHADAVLPAYLFGVVGDLQLRYTLKAELQWLPALDIAGNRLPNVFVDRAPGPESPVLHDLTELAAGVEHDTAAVIFPEGTFFTPGRLDRAATRLATHRPDLESPARSLRHMLPPRPAGMLALLRGAPDADVVIIGHAGLSSFSSLGDIIRTIPLRDAWRVRTWRHPRAEVPTDPDEVVTWLLDRWLDVDAWIDEQLADRDRPTPAAAA